MIHNKRRLIGYLIIVSLLVFGIAFPLPFYIYKPGSADPLNPVVQVDKGYESNGEIHLVTVRGGQATPLQYLWSKFQSYHDIERMENVFPEGYDRERYLQAQLQLMENSQEASTIVAYEAAEKEINISYQGVYVVDVLPGMPAEEVLLIGDKIIAVDNQKVTDANSLIALVNQYEVGEQISVTVERDEILFDEYLELTPFPDNPDHFGIGIHLVTNRVVTVEQTLEFSSGNIGGPSAGLMLALEIYDQLTETDLTRGYQIVGTGELNYQGDVLRIGGVDKKVVAADRSGGDVFFVPHEKGAPNSNYQLAKETADAIGTTMKIVPVDTFAEALEYLESLD